LCQPVIWSLRVIIAAITKAGGFGFLGLVREPPSLIRKKVEAVRRATTKRFGANLIAAATDSELLERQLEPVASDSLVGAAELIELDLGQWGEGAIWKFFEIGS
jgi:NAD(P)H-dependent flavin oxidoreductase YrpB (nitropropane dioxygenase family)